MKGRASAPPDFWSAKRITPKPNCSCSRAIRDSSSARPACPPILNAPRRITEALERLVQLYDAWGKPAQAAEWKQKLAEFQQAAKATEKKQP